jgi:gliding motility-associated lipoprotein GldH
MTKKINSHSFIGACSGALLLLSLTGCNKSVVYSRYETFKDNEWFAKDKAVFEVEIKDTLSLNNISIMVRHADAYPYNNLFLFVTTKYPDGKQLTDTMEIIMASDKGEWKGSGAGDIYDLKVPVKKNVRFPLGGKYIFSFEHGMRVDPLPMIMDLGFEVEKSKE